MATGRTSVDAAVERLDVSAYTIPTDAPESDGTAEWDSTTLVVVRAGAGRAEGLGYTYGDVSTASLVDSALKDAVLGRDTLAVGAAWAAMAGAIRNAGRPGVGSMALSAVDIALWDLKARLLELPLVTLLDGVHDAVPIYGSGGFTSYSLSRLSEQLAGWVEQGIPRVKMKVGRDPGADPARLDAARSAIGDEAALYVDANGAFARKEALARAERYTSDWGVSWLEEPVSSADLEGLRLLRDRSPGGLDIAAGEYAYVPADFRNLVQAGAVDCMQADVTRCGGITGLLRASGLCAAHELDLSAHCAPAVSAHAFCAVPRLRHLEYFHDHARIERMLFDGAPAPQGGALRPDRSRPGLGLALRDGDASRYAVYGGRGAP